jgi:(4S)-4-hydroxy-5-phosphonooxypentane-2,3-dione isomerase
MMRKSVFIIALLVAGIISGCASSGDKTTTDPGHSKIIAARLYIQPESVDEFIELFRELTALTLQEPGCRVYDLLQDPVDRTKFLVFEIYDDQAAVDAHFSAPYFAEYGEKIGALAARPAEIVVYDVAGETRPF